MKKMIIAFALVAAAVCAKAAAVDWSASATKADVGAKVYLLTAIADSYADVGSLISSAVGDVGVVAAQGRSYGTQVVKPVDAAITSSSNFYLALVAEDEKSFTYIDVTSGMSAMVYDPQAQETSKGTFKSSISAISAGTQMNIGQAVPEPTSGLLLLLGMAGLALRRKQK